MKSMGTPSDVSVGRARKTAFAECMSVLKAASMDDPFTNWLSTSERVRERYLRYVLMSGFRTGWVSLGRPRGGVCVATPIRTTADPCLFWGWLRFRLAISEVQWRALQQVSAVVWEHSEEAGAMIWYVGIVRRFRGGRLPFRLVSRALPDQESTSVLIQTVRPSLARLVAREGGEELAQISLPTEPLTMRLYRLDDRQVQRLRRGL